MSSKKLDQEISDLHALVSALDSDASGSDDSYIEIIETTTPPPPLPNLLQRSFLFTGTLSRSYFAKNTIALLIFTGIVAVLVDERTLDEGWGILLMALAAWSLIATLVKRWRDTGNSMWWLLTFLIPYVFLITSVFVIFAPTKKTP